jgi:hypothetical protein
MKATIYIEWKNGTKAAIGCDWNTDGIFDNPEGLFELLHSADFEEAWATSCPVEAYVQQNDPPNYRREIHFDYDADVIYTLPVTAKG